MKQVIKDILNKCGVVIRRKQPWMGNYAWLTNLNINTVIDIGANEGQFAQQAREIFPSAVIHSFEPIKPVFEKLKKNLSADPNTRLYNFALGDIEGEVEMYINDFSPSSSILELDKAHLDNYSHATKTSKETITVNTLDSILTPGSVKSNILIKVDVQGYEDKVILGGQNLFKSATVAIVETSYKMMYKDQKLFEDIYGLMTGLGFKYRGNFGELNYENKTGEILFGDAIFIKD